MTITAPSLRELFRFRPAIQNNNSVPTPKPQPPAPPPTAANVTDSFERVKNDDGLGAFNREVQKKIREKSPEWMAEAVGLQAAKSPEDAKRGADQAIAAANVMSASGDVDLGAKTLLKSGDALSKAGRNEEARRVYGELKRAPYDKAETNTSKNILDPMHEKDGTTTLVDRKKFETSNAALADRKIEQTKQLDDMERVLGKKVDPHDVGQVKEYFQKLSKGKSAGEVGSEWQRYLQNFTKHPGSVSWTKDVKPDDRPGKMGELLKKQPTDEAGRKLIDCEGYTYLTQSVLGDIKDDKGNARFSVVHAGNSTHVVAGVFEKKTNQGFVMDNDQMKPQSSPFLQQGEKGYRVVMRAYLNTSFVGPRPSDAMDPKAPSID